MNSVDETAPALDAVGVVAAGAVDPLVFAAVNG
jgi:hypothetical protein